MPEYSQSSTKTDAISAFFNAHSKLELHQKISNPNGTSGILSYLKYIHHITPNCYAIKTTDKRNIGQITEVKDGIFPFFIRKAILNIRRPCHFLVQDQHGNILFHIYRPFWFFFSQLTIKDTQGRILGKVKRKFSLFHKVYKLFVFHQSNPFAMIQSNLFRIWTFPVLDAHKNPIAEIKKKWNQALKEVFTDLDILSIEFQSLPLSQKIVIFATAISVDFDYFESNHSR